MPKNSFEPMVVHFQIDSERAVRDAFARYHAELGYPKILVSQEEFPDYVLEDVSGNKIRAEAEFRSSDFVRHNHPVDGCDLVICWEVDEKLCIPTLELCRYIETPCVFENFKEGELDYLPEHITRCVNVATKCMNLMKDTANLTRRRDRRSVCSEVFEEHVKLGRSLLAIKSYSQAYGREGWGTKPVEVTIDVLNTEVIIEGNLYPFNPKSVPLETMKDAQNEGFKCFVKLPHPVKVWSYTDIDTFDIEQLKDKTIAFVKRHGIDFLYQKSELLISSLSATIIALLDLLENTKLYGQQNFSHR